MIGFNYISRPYVSKTDLNVLNKTFDNLETGHLKAIEAASDLQSAVNMLKMDNSEDGFKAQLVDEIQQAIDENTLYGNSSFALSELLRKKSILTRPDVLGRINANAARQQFLDNLSKRNDISEGMKEMYRDLNPYHYEDKYDENGKIIGGTEWKPDKSPVSTIDLFKLMAAAKNILTEEYGKSEHITFLDANGKETTKAEDSFDGSMYRKVGTEYHRLPQDKIERAIRMAINSTPGAMDSLIQDREYAMWYHEKHKDDKDYTPDKTILDDNGNYYGLDEFINNKIIPFAREASYNNVINHVDFGTALQNYNTMKANLAAAGSGADSSFGIGTNILGMLDIDNNDFATLSDTKNKSEDSFLSAYEKLFGVNLTKGRNIPGLKSMYANKFGYEINNNEDFINALSAEYTKRTKKEMPAEFRNNVANYLRIYDYTNEDMNTRIENAGPYKDGMKFSRDVATMTFREDNKYGKAIIYLNNKYLAKGNLIYTMDNELYSIFINNLNPDIKNVLNNYTKKDDKGNYMITINSDLRNIAPLFINTLSGIENITRKHSSVDYQKGGKIIKKEVSFVVDGVPIYSGEDGRSIHHKYYTIYSEGITKAAKGEAYTSTGHGTMTFMGTTGNGVRDIELDHMLSTGQIDISTYNSLKKDAKDKLDRLFATSQLFQGMIYKVEGTNLIKDVENGVDDGNLINEMYQAYPNQIKRVYSVGNGISTAYGNQVPQSGYFISFKVPESAKSGALGKHKGESFSFFVAGTMDEGTNYNPSLQTSNIAHNKRTTASTTRTYIPTIGFSKELGDTNIKGNDDGTVRINCCGKSRDADYNTSETFIECLLTAENYKTIYGNIPRDSSGKFYTEQGRSQANIINETYKSLATTMAPIIGISEEAMYSSLLHYLIGQ